MNDGKEKKPYFAGRGGDYARNQTISIVSLFIVLLLIVGFVESGMYDWVMQWFW